VSLKEKRGGEKHLGKGKEKMVSWGILAVSGKSQKTNYRGSKRRSDKLFPVIKKKLRAGGAEAETETHVNLGHRKSGEKVKGKGKNLWLPVSLRGKDERKGQVETSRN